MLAMTYRFRFFEAPANEMVTPARYCMRETRNNVQSSRHGIVRNRRQSGRLRDFVFVRKIYDSCSNV